LDGLEQRKKAALGRGLWELFRHTQCRGKLTWVVRLTSEPPASESY
jgi:hypothetical protein